MRWWLGEYLDDNQIDENAFLRSYADLHADLRHIKKYLEVDDANLDAKTLLKRINEGKSNNTYMHIADAIGNAALMPDGNAPEAQEIRRFHLSWQERMRSDMYKQDQYDNEIVERLTLLYEEGFPFRQLTGNNAVSEPVQAYASLLSKLLKSPSKNSAELFKQLEKLLRLAEPKHVERIVELTNLLAFHFVPEKIIQMRESNGVTIGSDNPAPALYRMIHNWRNEYASQLCEYDGQEGGVKGAVPLPRTALESDDFVFAVAERLHNGIDDVHLARAGAEGYEIERMSFSDRQLGGLDRELNNESKTAGSRFVYALEPGVLDSESAESLATRLPSLRHYSNQVEQEETVPEVEDLNSFLKTAGKLIDKRLKDFNSDEPLHEFSRLLEAALKESGHSAQLAEAPKTKDRVKYLKWFNEVLKTDKSVREAIERHPDLVEKVSEIYSSVKQIAASKFDAISTLIQP